MFHRMTMLALVLVPAMAVAQTSTAPTTQPECCEVPGRLNLISRASGQINPPPSTQPSTREGMVWIAGGEFSMGSNDPLARDDEQPVHRVRVDGFWIDQTEVTNAQFAKFVKETKYVTVAERPVVWEEMKKQLPAGTPKPDDAMLKPGSLLFTPPDHPVDLRQYQLWWSWTLGTDWRHPEGPASNLDGKDNLPVVHVAFEDALAYCKWAGKSLPTEAQWEYAARGGLDGKVNVWGNEPVDGKRANTWQGHFPDKNTAEDGFPRVAPVKSFPANGYGLYDMAGNVWEWCSDLYRPDQYALEVAAAGPGKVIVNPKGPEKSFDPRNPDAPESRVHRGGSFLCSDAYCASYRPSARMAVPPDTGMQHLGFRCVMSENARKSQPSVPTTGDANSSPAK